jgi:hypothetical protein
MMTMSRNPVLFFSIERNPVLEPIDSRQSCPVLDEMRSLLLLLAFNLLILMFSFHPLVQYSLGNTKIQWPP